MRYNPDIKVGLSTEEVNKRVSENLVNYNDQPPTKSIGKILRDNFFTYFNFINTVLAVAIIFAGIIGGELFEAIKNCTFMGVVIINSIISSGQEIISKKIIDKLSVLASSKIKTIRNSKEVLLELDEVVLDDVIKAQAQYMNPYILEERQLNVTQMDVFSRLMMDRIIFLGTQIDDYTANTLQAQLLYLDSVDSGKDISIYLNSPGGSVTAGLGIYDTMQFISSDVATICTGMAASMAAVLLVSGQEGKRSALPHSRVMIHQPLGGVQGQASDIEIEAREILKMKKELYTIISDHSHTPYDKVYADSDRNYWMTAEEAKEYGMIDNVLVRK